MVLECLLLDRRKLLELFPGKCRQHRADPFKRDVQILGQFIIHGIGSHHKLRLQRTRRGVIPSMDDGAVGLRRVSADIIPLIYHRYMDLIFGQFPCDGAAHCACSYHYYICLLHVSPSCFLPASNLHSKPAAGHQA